MDQALSFDDVEFVVGLAETAGVGLRRRFRAPSEQLELQHKGPRDLVTVADKESEAVIVSGLRQRFPECSILAEEGSPDLEIDWTGEESFWIVDPLDGTTNFAHGFPFFSVSIAWWHAGAVRAGVVHAPMQGETFWAVRGHGSFLRSGASGGRGQTSDTGAKPVALRVSSESELSRVLLATGFSYGRREIDDGAMGSFADLLASAREVRRAGSACLDLAYTAAGVLGGFWEYYLKPHDTAAGALLVSEAGGRVTDVAGGNDFIFGGSIVAASPLIHPEILRVLRKGPRHPGRTSS